MFFYSKVLYLQISLATFWDLLGFRQSVVMNTVWDLIPNDLTEPKALIFKSR